MAFNKLSSPALDNFSSIYRPIFVQFVRTADDNTVMNMRLIVNNVGTEHIALDFDLNSNIWTYNFEDVLKDLISYDIQPMGTFALPTETEALDAPNSYKEVWYTGNSLKTGGSDLYAPQPLTDTFYAFNATVQHTQSQDFDTYITPSVQRKFLSNAPIYFNNIVAPVLGETFAKQMFKANEQFFISVLSKKTFNAGAGLGCILAVATGSNTTGIIQVVYIDLQPTVGALPFYPNVRFDVGVGGANLNEATLMIGSQPVVTSAVDYVMFYLADGNTGATESEAGVYYIDKGNCDYKRLYWLNRLGGIDTFAFRGNEIRSIETERTLYDKRIGYTVDPVPPSNYSFDINSEGKTVLGIKSEYRYELYSSVLTQAERIWLEELLDAPKVWLLIEDDTQFHYEPIVLENAETTTVDDSANLYQIAIQYKPANQNIRQR